jgi:hypothetical protein
MWVLAVRGIVFGGSVELHGLPDCLVCSTLNGLGRTMEEGRA